MKDLERLQKGLCKAINKRFENHRHVHFVKVQPEDISIRLNQQTALRCRGDEVKGLVYSPSLQIGINLPPEETKREKRDEFVTARREADSAMREYLRGIPSLSASIATSGEPRAVWKSIIKLKINDTLPKGFPKNRDVVVPLS